MSTRFIRSALYVPASNQKAIDKARTLACDAVILDLEDGVAPEEKIKAREQAVAAVRAGGFGHRRLAVRVNGFGTPWWYADLNAVAGAAPEAILVPKVNCASDVQSYQRELDRTRSPARLWAMIETPRSVFQLDSIADTSRTTRLSCFVLGTNDLAKEMRVQPGADRALFFGIFGLAVAAARAADITILDGVFNGIDDDAGFLSQCTQAVEFGFDGKTLIHPNQIDPCNRCFTPSEAAEDWARRVIAAFETPEHREHGVLRLDGQMVERLHLAQALDVVRRADAARAG